MFKPVEVKALADHKLWLRYEDATQGVVDLSHLVGKGVFALWNTDGVFEQVYIGAHGAISWSSQIELCPDALYLKLTGQEPGDVFPALKEIHVDA